MSGWIVVAIIVTVWVTVAVVLALVIARAVRLRDRNEKPGEIGGRPLDLPPRARRDR
ncbi:hypothetical protein [Gordonia sp. SL306]|uniref:hypothetical protein n=1 Tax=Gordonia sp. SL306 TaxID=2995145 RepID=UPI00226E15CA|nr:hypothetical protein [Gordonia sp. SL306]WAC56749.1 hypothetical protein OVA31_05705 [Gordonia sp. SL306]